MVKKICNFLGPSSAMGIVWGLFESMQVSQRHSKAVLANDHSKDGRSLKLTRQGCFTRKGRTKEKKTIRHNHDEYE